MARDHKSPEAETSRRESPNSGTQDSGSSWQFRFVLAAISLGLIVLILKALGVL